MNVHHRHRTCSVAFILYVAATSLLHVQVSIGMPMITNTDTVWSARVFETSAAGHALTEIQAIPPNSDAISIELDTQAKRQLILGFGGSFTEASAHVLDALSTRQRDKIIDAYFSDEGARYSLARTHINSCDFSLEHYAYAMVPGDTALDHFSIDKDIRDLFPMIKSAQRSSSDGFKLIASPWTAPPWMKDNNSWLGGKLLPKYRGTWALYYSKYIKACAEQGVPIWGITVINEPHGNGNNWESMLFSPKEMTDFVQEYLTPTLRREGLSSVNVLGYDQNRAGLKEWVDEMFRDTSSSQCFSGTAIHWYESTFDYFPSELRYAAERAPGKYLIQTEACIDAEIPRWKDDAWYWKEEATDWGWDWASQDQKHLHPKYAPVHRYARDIIGCLQNSVHGWIDWNMVLNRQGGPNWAKNWCTAPVIADTATDEVYFTPLYYVMSHFSKFIRPGARVVGSSCDHPDIMVTAAENPDASIAVIVFNPTNSKQTLKVNLPGDLVFVQINEQALQTMIFSRR